MVADAHRRSAAWDERNATTPKASTWQQRTHHRLLVKSPDYWLKKLRDDDRLQDLYVELKQAVENHTLPDPRPAIPHTVQVSHDKSLWEFGRLRENFKALNFQPEQYTTMVDGRPVQVLCLTHERVQAEELPPYLAIALAPCRPLCVYGQCRALEPGDGRQLGFRHVDVVGSAWHDMLIAYMADKRHPLDILFLLAEQDY